MPVLVSVEMLEIVAFNQIGLALLTRLVHFGKHSALDVVVGLGDGDILATRFADA